MDLLVELGIRRITMTAIDERSGVSKATFYRHWTSLEDVVYDAVAAGIWPPGEATLDPPTSDQLHEAADAVASMINNPAHHRGSRCPHPSRRQRRPIHRARGPGCRAAILAPLMTNLQAADPQGSSTEPLTSKKPSPKSSPHGLQPLSGRPPTAAIAHAHIDRVPVVSSTAEPAPGPSTPLSIQQLSRRGRRPRSSMPSARAMERTVAPAAT